MNNIRLLAGRSNPELAELISKNLEIPLTKVEIVDFHNTELRVRILENIRKKDVYILQTGGAYDGKTINDYLIELYALVQACKLSSAQSISVVLPTYPYARGDKKDQSRTTIMGSLVARQLEDLGVNRIIAMDLHAAQLQGFTKLPFDNLYAKNLHCEHLHNTLFKGLTQDEINEKYILVSPDVGGVKRVQDYAAKLKMAHVTLNKRRDHSKPGVVESSELSGGEDKLKDKVAIIIDDMVDTCNSVVFGSLELMKYGAIGVVVLTTHGVLSGQALDRINASDTLLKVVVTNTLPQLHNKEKCPKLEIIDTSNLFSEVIKRIELGGSISELFN